MSELTLFLVTFPSQAEAETVAECVVQEGLAACANILPPATSIFRWQGAVQRASEIPVLFKTRAMLTTRLRTRLVELHSYDLPVIESWSATTDANTAEWIAQETR